LLILASKLDYYDTLGVSRDASQDEIKRAFRKLAYKYHPDRSKIPDAEAKFKEASEAYAILSDPEKRRQYDAVGFEGIKNHYTSEDLYARQNVQDTFSEFGFDVNDLFTRLFGGGFTFQRGRPEPHRGRDLETQIEVTLEQAAFGAEVGIAFPHSKRCPRCGGSGSEPGSHVVTCPQCQGSGRIAHDIRSASRVSQMIVPCDRCNGRGEVAEKTCTRCGGEGLEARRTRLTVKIPPGIDTGDRLALRGQGDDAPSGGPSGDLYVTVRIKPHPYLMRRGLDLVYEAQINFAQAALGTEIEVPALTDRKKVRVPPGTQSGTMLRLRGEGIKSGTRQGDELVQVTVRTPEMLTHNERKLIEELAKEFEAN
jgi:molecular chaperone DnaJ